MVEPNSVTKINFNNGQKAPILGLGTWQSPPDGSVYKAVKAAIENGYRHIDCAHIYQNQEEVGRAIADCISAKIVKREDLFIVSKVWLTFYRKDRVPICVNKILKDLKLDYADLILLHWPMSFKQQDESLFPVDDSGKVIDGGVDFVEAWQALEPLVDQGLIKSIGVSNFTVEQIERLLTVARIKPVVNQVECHPYLAQQKLKDTCDKHDIRLTAYSPLGNPGSQVNSAKDKDKLLKDPVVNALAQKYKKNPGQILIKFQVQRGILVIPKSVNLDRIVSNIQVFDFEMTPEEIKQLLALDRNYRSCGFATTSHLRNFPFN